MDDAIAMVMTMVGARGVASSAFVPEWAALFSAATYTRQGVSLQLGVFCTAALMIVGFAIAWFGTNSQTLLGRKRWTAGHGIAIAMLAITALLNLDRVTEFLYFNF